MTRRPLTDLQLQLIERHRQNGSGRAAMVAVALEDTAPTGLAAEWAEAQRRQEHAEPQALGGLDFNAIWARWNAPRAASLREQAEKELHRPEPEHLDADSIYKKWNTT